jgi:hypothetical protein
MGRLCLNSMSQPYAESIISPCLSRPQYPRAGSRILYWPAIWPYMLVRLLKTQDINRQQIY